MSSSQCEASVKVMELKFCPPADACTLSEVCLRLLPGHFAFYGLAPNKWRDSVVSLVLNRYYILETALLIFSWEKHYFSILKLGMLCWPHLCPAICLLQGHSSWPWLHSSVLPLTTPCWLWEKIWTDAPLTGTTHKWWRPQLTPHSSGLFKSFPAQGWEVVSVRKRPSEAKP